MICFPKRPPSSRQGIVLNWKLVWCVARPDKRMKLHSRKIHEVMHAQLSVLAVVFATFYCQPALPNSSWNSRCLHGEKKIRSCVLPALKNEMFGYTDGDFRQTKVFVQSKRAGIKVRIRVKPLSHSETSDVELSVSSRNESRKTEKAADHVQKHFFRIPKKKNRSR